MIWAGVGSSVEFDCARVWRITLGHGGPAMLVGGASTRRVRTPSVQATIGTWKPSVITVPQPQ